MRRLRANPELNALFVGQLEKTAGASLRFHVLVVFSCAIATLGLIADSTAVVIGAMLVAPLLTPIMGLALGSVRGRVPLLLSSSVALAGGIVVAILLSATLAWLAHALPFDALVTLPAEAQARTRPNPFDLAIALAGGAVGAYALARLPNSDALPGVAIATALMPPLCTIGIGIALNDRGVWGGAALLFVTNLSAIVFAAIVVFGMLGLRPQRWHAGVFPTALALVLLVVVAATLTGLTLRAIAESRQDDAVRNAVSSALRAQRPNSDLVSLETSESGGTLHLRVTVRTATEVSLAEVESIQSIVAQRLQKRVALVFVSIPAVLLDPLKPPAKSETLAPVPTPTPKPTPSPTGRTFVLPFQIFVPAINRD